MKNKLLLPIVLLAASASVFAGEKDATTTLHWKGIVPTVTPGDAVIITGPNGLLPYADSAGLIVTTNDGTFTSDKIYLELHHRACTDPTITDGSCAAGEFNMTDDAAAVGDIIPEPTWTMSAVDTVVGTMDVSDLQTEVNLDGSPMAQGSPESGGATVSFTTSNEAILGTGTLAAGQNIEVHTVINSSSTI